MTPESWNRIKEILAAAWERGPEERDAFLRDACGTDIELRVQVEALLTSDRRADGFFEKPAEAAAAAGGLIDAAFESISDEISDNEADLTDRRIGRYTITGLIGKGGMGAVYRAVRTDDFRMEVAIKLLKRGTDTDAALTRFRAERQILARLQHPNIAHLLDGGATETGLPYLVMEHVAGTALLEYTAKLPLKQRLVLFRSICEAVQYAHKSNVVHRDIKPTNILVTAGGVPKLLDFGIAKLLDPFAEDLTMALTATGVRLMTPAYASPEQARGEPVTAATDIYSLGAVLYELVTGQLAHIFKGRSPEAIQLEVCTREPRRPSAIVKGLDQDLDKIILKAMAKNPAQRYGSARELAEDLDRFLSDVPVWARRKGWEYRGRQFKRNGMLLAAFAAASVLVFLGVKGMERAHRDTAGRWSHLTFEKIVALGDAAPGGGTFDKQFYPGPLNNHGDVVFSAYVGVARLALFFRNRGKPPVQLARTGDPAPGGGTYSRDIAGVSINDSGDVAFTFGMEPFTPPELKGFAKEALFRYSARDRKITQLIVPSVTTTPGYGAFLTTFMRPMLNNAGDIVFPAAIRTPTGASRTGDVGSGIFVLKRTGQFAKVAVAGDPAPGGGAFDYLQNPSINDTGEIAFGAHVAGEECVNPIPAGCNESVYFRSASSEKIESIAHQDEQGPGSSRYLDAWGALVNNRGDVVFIADFAPVQGRTSAGAIFLHTNDATIPIAGPSTVMPDGRVVLTVNPSSSVDNFSLNNRGEISFNALMTNGDSGIYVYSQGRLHLVAGTGTVMPGIGRIQSVGSYVGNGGTMNDNGQVFFWATLTDRRGVLLIAAPQAGGSN